MLHAWRVLRERHIPAASVRVSVLNELRPRIALQECCRVCVCVSVIRLVLNHNRSVVPVYFYPLWSGLVSSSIPVCVCVSRPGERRPLLQRHGRERASGWGGWWWWRRGRSRDRGAVWKRERDEWTRGGGDCFSDVWLTAVNSASSLIRYSLLMMHRDGEKHTPAWVTAKHHLICIDLFIYTRIYTHIIYMNVCMCYKKINHFIYNIINLN